RYRGGMDSSLRLGLRHTLHTMNALLVLETAKGAFSAHHTDDFFIAACRSFTGTHQLHLPAPPFDIARIHTEEIACKYARFIAAGARPDFHDDVFVVIRILRNEQHAHALFETFHLG